MAPYFFYIMSTLYIQIKSVWLEPLTQNLSYLDEIEIKSTIPFSNFVSIDYEKGQILEKTSNFPKRQIIEINQSII